MVLSLSGACAVSLPRRASRSWRRVASRWRRGRGRIQAVLMAASRRGRGCPAERGTWRALKRLATNIAGLDLVLQGGLERGAVVIVAGAPGTGKTILAQQICFANGTAEHKCVYYTTVSEPHTKLVRHLESFSFFDPQALGARVEHIHLGDFLRPARQDGLEPLV